MPNRQETHRLTQAAQHAEQTNQEWRNAMANFGPDEQGSLEVQRRLWHLWLQREYAQRVLADTEAWVSRQGVPSHLRQQLLQRFRRHNALPLTGPTAKRTTRNA